MAYVPENVIEALRGSHQLGIFFRIDTVPALHLWVGINDIPAHIDSVEPDGTVYLGGGRLIGVPSLEVLVNGTADSVEFSISGVDPATGAAALASIPPVRGKEVLLGITTLDQYFQPMSSIIPIWRGVASHATETSAAGASNSSPSMTLGLVISAGEPTRSRASRAMWSSPHQKAISPTDLFCDGTARLARGVQPVWPHYS